MKKYALLMLAVALVLVFIPSGVCAYAKSEKENSAVPQVFPVTTDTAVQKPVGEDKTAEKNDASEENKHSKKIPPNVESDTAPPRETVAVFLPEKKESVEMAMRDYIICCIAAEMPAVYDLQALCAQGLACVTLARYLTEHGSNKENGDIVADPKVHQGYMSVDEMKSRWGKDFQKYYDKLCTAADTVLDYTLMYDGKTALTAFHAMSAGETEDAANVWGKSIPYLVSVDSSGDKSAKNYLTVTTFTAEEIRKKLSLREFSEDKNQWVRNESYTKAGRLKSIEIGEKEFSGETLRSLLNLRSCAISISVKDGNFVFETRGYGHGVGMSQTGADYLARQGPSWQEIIAHYYPGTVLVSR